MIKAVVAPAMEERQRRKRVEESMQEGRPKYTSWFVQDKQEEFGKKVQQDLMRSRATVDRCRGSLNSKRSYISLIHSIP